MNRIVQVLLVSYICSLLLLFFDFSEAKTGTVRRQRRYLGFRNISHFFLRLNFKANMVPWNQIFAQALGFRVNWDDPPDSFHPFHHVHRRGLYKSLELLLDRNGLNGFHCIRRAICEMKDITQPNGIYFKILKMIFRRQSSETDQWHKYSPEDCEIALRNCPFSMLEVSPYTDL